MWKHWKIEKPEIGRQFVVYVEPDETFEQFWFENSTGKIRLWSASSMNLQSFSDDEIAESLFTYWCYREELINTFEKGL